MKALIVFAGLAWLGAGIAQAGVDWSRGLVAADGLGIADRHAPNPAVARGTSRRAAEAAARATLATEIAALPAASGGTIGAHASDPAVKARLAAAVANAYAIAAEPETDGSWHVTMAVPIEAIRQALDGERALPAAGDAGPPVVIVDGAGAAAPAVGWTVGGLHAATIWTAAVPAWARAAPHARAAAVGHGAIALAASAGSSATLYVILTK